MIKELTKAESLKFLKKYSENKFVIPEFIYISLKNFSRNEDSFVKIIQKKFKRKKIIIRSSALDEDNMNKSNAGKYLSLKSSSDNYQEILLKIKKVIKHFRNKDDQILIQEFIIKPQISGVIFTKDPKNGSDYYVINYDKSQLTDLITSGKKNEKMKTLIVYKSKIHLSKKFSKILKVIKYIEEKYQNNSLDIEFCFKNKKMFIFQCRNLILKNRTINIDEYLVNIFKKIKKISSNPSLPGRKTVLSNMSDWNPAEIIGFKPSKLAITLYDELITNSVWAEQRKNYGYKNVQPNALMYNLFGFPYIDLKTDFNSFLPKELPKDLSEKIVNDSINKITKYPYLHDKIEFEVIETCYDFFSKEKVKFLKKKKDRDLYIKNLKILTINILKNANKIIKDEYSKINKFEDQLNFIDQSKLSEVQRIYFIIHNIKTNGTLPFAGIARIAFITTKILKSFLNTKIITSSELEKFYGSVNLCTNDILIKANKAFNDKKKLKDFNKSYGHLRPSTYSIVSKNYKEGFTNYFQSNNLKKKKINNFNFKSSKMKQMQKMFNDHKIKINIREFLNISKNSIKLREDFKLIFSKGIDKIFENLIALGNEMKIPREDLQYLSILEFKEKYQSLDINKLSSILKKNIRQNKKDFKVLRYINLPDVIVNPNSVYCFEKSQAKGNFITNKVIIGKILAYNKDVNKVMFKNNIILIENADPGFDFLFGLGIKGLITRYGGVNSHMAIRCLEENIPACIGIGEDNFEKIKKNKIIQLNCFQNNFKILS